MQNRAHRSLIYVVGLSKFWWDTVEIIPNRLGMELDLKNIRTLQYHHTFLIVFICMLIKNNDWLDGWRRTLQVSWMSATCVICGNQNWKSHKVALWTSRGHVDYDVSSWKKKLPFICGFLLLKSCTKWMILQNLGPCTF